MTRMAFLGLIVWAIAPITHAGDLENIGACVDAASQHSGVDLDMRSVTYEPHVFSNSTATWSNAYCEIKFEKVYVLKIEGKDVVVDGYAGQEAFDLNETLAQRTRAAMDQLDLRKEELARRMREASGRLERPKPDHAAIEEFVNDGISDALNEAGLSEVVSEQNAQRLIEEARIATQAENERNRLARAEQAERERAVAAASQAASKPNVQFTEKDFYWDSETTPHKATIIAGVNKVFRENSRCESIDASSAYVSSGRGTADNPVFFVTCKNDGNAFNVFFSKSDVENEIILRAVSHVDRSTAIGRCEEYAKSLANYPSTVEFSKVVDLNVIEHPNGRTSVASTFTAKNGSNLEVKFNISCMMDNAELFEATVVEAN